MTIIDLFREFSSTASMNGYPTAARTLYYTMLYVWNERRRPATVQLTALELRALAGLSNSTFQSAFSYLSDRGWVKRRQSRNRNVFVYELTARGLENVGSGATVGGLNDAHATRETERKNPPPADSSHDHEVTAHEPTDTDRLGAISPISDLDGILAATRRATGLREDPFPFDS